MPRLSRHELLQWVGVAVTLGLAAAFLVFSSTDRPLVRRRTSVLAPSRLVLAVIEDIASPNRHSVVSRVLLVPPSTAIGSAPLPDSCVLEVAFPSQSAWPTEPVPIEVAWASSSSLVVRYDPRAKPSIHRSRWHSIAISF